MTMLEKAARAAAKADATLHNGPDLYDKNPDLYLRLTRAVLMAVREPDERHFSPVRAAGQWSLVAASAPVSDHVKAAADAQKCFTSMIDAILNEEPSNG
ncbi:hypothetical protein [Brevundimonas diminuta]|uniref:hypothetical protein n=1 Tax=Brevundimonas diminuta TaxID=293 RepID=UPI003D9A1F55